VGVFTPTRAFAILGGMTRHLGVVGLMVVLAWPVSLPVFAETDAERRERIEAQLQQIEMQMIQSQRQLEAKQTERQSLERDLDILDTQITNAALGVQARELAINQLTAQIEDKLVTISVLNERLDKQRRSVADLVRKTNEVDDFSMVEILLSNQNLSEFFTDFESFRSINNSLADSLQALEQIKLDTEEQKEGLEERQLTEAELKARQEAEKAAIEAREREKEQILTVTRGEEEAYQDLLASQQKTVAQLRAQLFELLGGGGAIPFPQAVDLAVTAGTAVGVEPALILAILEQESAYGSNIGGCTMGDVRSGRDIMHPTRDKPIFLGIAATLGFDPATQAVSCPLIQNGQRIGWGGAMGASQFIPSTWGIYGGFPNGSTSYVQNRDVIRQMLGLDRPSNPFVNQDAFTATALLLRDNGANGTYGGDRLAALRYYAGWGGASRPENQFYGNQVAERKERLKREIQTLLSG
jgi:peptidoglycan hydrolase CwlO-like protein